MFFGRKFLNKLIISLIIYVISVLSLNADPSGIRMINSKNITNSISQYGITWKFTKAVEYGQFINGDYWVIGPVIVESVDPEPTIGNGYFLNGSMVNPPNGSQSYDSRTIAWSVPFDEDLKVEFPVTINNNSSLVSTISREPLDEPQRPALRGASVLTVLKAPPEEGSFRPGLIGDEKIIYNVNDIRWALLPSLTPTASIPTSNDISEDYTRWFERPWLLHSSGWKHRHTMPEQNSPSYHRDVALLLSQAAVLCITDWGDRTDLVINYLQVCIDYYTMQRHGSITGIPGAYNYRWPIIFAGILLGDDSMRDLWIDGDFSTPGYHDDQIYSWSERTRTVPSEIIPENETWTYYTLRTGKEAVFYGDRDAGNRDGHDMLHPSEWGWIEDAGYVGGGAKQEVYRRMHSCQTVGFALSILAFNAEIYLSKSNYLPYVDRWMSETPEDMATYGSPVNVHNVQTSACSWLDDMWFEYRNTF